MAAQLKRTKAGSVDIAFSGNMPQDDCGEHPLFGGAISSVFPLRFEDVSNVRQVPDHQEVFVDPSRDESLIFELLDLKHEVEDGGSAVWFLHDLATEQDAEGSVVLEHSNVSDTGILQYSGAPAIVHTAVGQMVYLANVRLKEVGTDVLIIAYEPTLINPLSESARIVGAGLTVPAMQMGCLPVAECQASRSMTGISSVVRHHLEVVSVGVAALLHHELLAVAGIALMSICGRHCSDEHVVLIRWFKSASRERF
ncbi:hypothetical protein ACLOJK_013035 [Asimina triloba]